MKHSCMFGDIFVSLLKWTLSKFMFQLLIHTWRKAISQQCHFYKKWKPIYVLCDTPITLHPKSTLYVNSPPKKEEKIERVFVNCWSEYSLSAMICDMSLLIFYPVKNLLLWLWFFLVCVMLSADVARDSLKFAESVSVTYLCNMPTKYFPFQMSSSSQKSH